MTKESGREVTVLWAGGWDTYLIDPTQLREMTPAELEKVARDKYSPVLGSHAWLRCLFLTGQYTLGSDTQVVKIIRRLGGGD